MIPYRVHIDTAYFIVIQRIMSNFADIKKCVTHPKQEQKHTFTSASKTYNYEEYF
nr:MAG TPA: hypothetical protein [Caudoviricetes sp.]